MERKEKPLMQHQNQKPKQPTKSEKNYGSWSWRCSLSFYLPQAETAACIAESTKKAWDVYQKEGRLRVGRGIVFLPLPPAGFWDRVTLGILECPRTGCVDHAGLKFIFITISTSRELGWQTWSTMTSLYHAGNHTQNVPHAEQVHYHNWATPRAHKFVLLSKALVILLYVNLSPSAFS